MVFETVTLKKRVVAVLLCIFVGLNASCAGNVAENTEDNKTDNSKENGQQISDTAPAWMRYASEEITLDWYINYSWYATPWGENAVSKKITEETGISINFITPLGNEQEKLNSLIVSNSLPDLITLGWWEPQVNQMISGDMVYALNELADKYDVYFWEVTDEDVLKWYMQENGNIYAYPNSAVSPKDFNENNEIGSNQTFLVRKDIYEAIGSPDMTTTEGFYEAVKKAYEMFPTIDGKDMIPIGAHVFDSEGNVSFDKYLMNFLAIPWEIDGEVYDRYTDPEYLRWLKLFRRLASEGYLKDDVFVDTRTQMEEKIADGRYFCMIYQYSDMLSQQKTLYSKNPDSVYIAVDGPKNINLDNHRLTTQTLNGWTITLISKNCKHPERAIAFMDYLLSEHGQMITYLGIEGVTYEYVDGKPVLLQEVKELLNSDRNTYDKLYGADNAYWMMQDNVLQGKWKQETPEAISQLEHWSYKYSVFEIASAIILPMGSEAQIADDKITKLWSRTLIELLLAASDEEFDDIVARFVSERDKLGFETAKKGKNLYIQRAKRLLGL